MGRKMKKFIAGTIAFIFITGLFSATAYLEYKREVESQRRELNDILNVLKARIENQLNKRMRNIAGLVTYIEVNPDIIEEEFLDFASRIIDDDDAIFHNATIIKDMKIAFVYPKEENEAAIGLDLSKVERQKDAVEFVKSSGRMTIDGPFTLVQGGEGVIYRMPVNLGYERNKYWGQISYVADYERLMKLSGVEEALEKFHIEIVQIDEYRNIKTIIASNYADFESDFVEGIVLLPNLKWEIRLEYLDGYDGRTEIFYILIIIGIMFGFLSVVYVVNLIQSRDDLEDSITTLREMQDQLILSEKLAELGGLTAGVAHEINTPIGLSITLASFLNSMKNSFVEKYDSGTLTRRDMDEFIGKTGESLEVMIGNLNRASELVRSFKMLASDQHYSEIRKINLKEYIDDIMISIRPKIKMTSHMVMLESEDDIEIYTDPGAISQIITNLVINSLDHAFVGIENGRIGMRIYRNEETASICIEYSDNGVGIPEDIKDKIFIPFFSTKKCKGNTGLGMHLIYNSVVNILNGTIRFESAEGKGTNFYIEFPEKK